MNTFDALTAEALSLERATNKGQLLSIPHLLSRYSQINGNHFHFNGTTIDNEYVYSPEMFLPIVCLEALRLWQTLENSAIADAYEITGDDTLDVVFVESESAFFPLAAYPPLLRKDQRVLSTLRLMCFNLANRRVFALQQNQSVDLDAFLDAWKDIDWYSDTIYPVLVPDSYNSRFMQHEFEHKRADYSLNKKQGESPKRNSETPTALNPFASREQGGKD